MFSTYELRWISNSKKGLLPLLMNKYIITSFTENPCTGVCSDYFCPTVPTVSHARRHTRGLQNCWECKHEATVFTGVRVVYELTALTETKWMTNWSNRVSAYNRLCGLEPIDSRLEGFFLLQEYQFQSGWMLAGLPCQLNGRSGASWE